MSIPAYISLGLGTALVILAYAVHPDGSFLLMVLPMLAVLGLVPAGIGHLNARQMSRVDAQGVKLRRLKQISEVPAGDIVRIRGNVESISWKWLNRPHYSVTDGSGLVRVMMYAVPRDRILVGDRVEAVVKLTGRAKVWGLKISKLG